jgi:hypothetical protein
MMSTARVTIDAGRVPPSKALAVLARSVPLLVVTHWAYAELVDELGGEDAAVRHLARVATNTGKPLAVNLPTGSETSTSVFVSPKGWSEEGLAGWAAGHHAELEAAFGPATVRRAVDL